MIATPSADVWIWPALAALLGLAAGSFVNVVIHRLPRMLERDWRAHCAELSGATPAAGPDFNLARPASRCPHCGVVIAWRDLLPLFSYLRLRGRCRACGTPIGLRYPLVELLGGLAGGAAAWYFGPTWQAALAMLLLWALLALAWIDLEHLLLPDSITLPLLWLGLLVNSQGLFVGLHEAVFGAVFGYLSLWSIHHLFYRLTGKEGMGHGDFKLLAALGAWLGWGLLPLVVAVASLSGALVGVGLILFAGHARGKPIPFGPYLALGGVIALFWGTALNAAYWS
jgi:leader peptidase (prepilin peptidase)/N-methyltransferase